MAGLLYFVFVVVLGIGFLRSTVAFASDSSTAQARRVLRASLIYLPLLFLLLLLDGYTNSIALAIWQ
jgi:protoheme IX farnesyltransferase